MFSYFENRKTIWFYVLYPNVIIETKVKTLFLTSYFNLSKKAKWHFRYTDSATLLKKRLWHKCFPVNFDKFLTTPLTEHRRTTASIAFLIFFSYQSR